MDGVTKRTASDVLLELQERHDFPMSAMVELTRRCNLRCRHCYLDLDDHPGLPHERLVRIWDELAAAGVLFLTFTGGEMTLRPDWLELAEAARARGFVVRLKTNAIALGDEAVDRIARLAVFAVDVSLYGPTAPVHDHVTCLPGSFERTMAAIRALREAGVAVSVRSPLLASNADSTGAVVDLAASLGCDPCFDPGLVGTILGDDDRASLRPEDGQVGAAVSLLVERGLFPRPRGEARAGKNCIERGGGLYVRADGEVWLCPSLPISFGSAAERSVVEVWRESEARRDLVARSRLEPPECAGCAERAYCSRCFGRSYLEHRSMDRPATADCRLAACLRGLSLDAGRRRCDTAPASDEEAGATPGPKGAAAPAGQTERWEG